MAPYRDVHSITVAPGNGTTVSASEIHHQRLALMNLRFHFGKYKGREIEEIRHRDAQYVAWAIENVSGFRAIAEESARTWTPPKKRKGKKAKKGDLLTWKPSNSWTAKDDKPKKEWRGWTPHSPDVVGDAIRADPILAYFMPCEMRMDSGFDVEEANMIFGPPY